MTIEERLEKLTERHEALAQSIELLALENRDRDERWEKRFGQLVTGLDQLAETVAKLIHLAEMH